MDDEKIEVAGIGEVYDDHNLPNMDKSVYDTPIAEDLKVTGSMKMIFIACGMVGIFYCLYKYGLFPAAIWTMALIFVLDMMGVFDKVGEFLRESRKPRGGYESIER